MLCKYTVLFAGTMLHAYTMLLSSRHMILYKYPVLLARTITCEYTVVF